ncbi:MAG: MarR family transcriptional regulator [Pseudonocardiaceae bacterium]|nr:MarR family transcriptional regulator [Pseudonocardiaceae bacterium]
MPATTGNTDARPAEGSLGGFETAWDEFFAALRRSRGRAARERGEELTLSQQNLLTALGEHPQLPVGEVALAAGVAPPTATRMLDHLERTGIVAREHSVRDRRVVTVALTEEGGRLLERKRAAVAEKRRALHESLTPAEREQAEHLLHRLAELLEQL